VWHSSTASRDFTEYGHPIGRSKDALSGVREKTAADALDHRRLNIQPTQPNVPVAIRIQILHFSN
jgi:hypothetical protein